MRWFILFWALTLLVLLFSVLDGCSSPITEDTIEECHYEHWHGHYVRICYDRKA